ncbi:MAG TPA: LptF/LptG family permease, partial [Puia sp.]|nr:LptF/LptG family permease [Puia sp.]
MIKKLDKLIIKAFIGPFIATFFITLFVLVLQFFWLYIDDIVGKGLDLFTIGRFIMYVCATLVPLALPLAVLLSSIMTFGNLGETFELVAIKSAGIPLLRFMRPLFITSIFICGIAFLFNNYIIPVAELKMQTLKYDIIVSKPAFDIKEGVFYDKIDGYIIKIGKKEKDGSTIKDILIYQQNYNLLQDNVIVAERGKMTITPDKKFLEFNLQDGWNYQEKGPHNSTNTELIRMGFKEYKKVFDLSSFKLNKTDDSAFKNNYQMLNMRQLNTTIDSLQRMT